MPEKKEELIESLKKAKEILDKTPIPTEDRMIYDPETDQFVELTPKS